MDQFPSDNLPPELDELGQRMSRERPVASGSALRRVMTRAQSARSGRKSMLWRSTAPRPPRKTIAVCVAGLIAAGTMTAAASAGPFDRLVGNLTNQLGLTQQTTSLLEAKVKTNDTSKNGGSPLKVDVSVLGNPILHEDAAATQYETPGDCPDGLVEAVVDAIPLAFVCAVVFPNTNNLECPDGFVEVDVVVPDLALVCVRAIDVDPVVDP